MINLHERLSEFSYGYGITREVETLLRGHGLVVAPFLPSLQQEKSLGFDVAFKKPGAVLMLQFKLGHSLSRFVRRKKSQIIPSLRRPFWRFELNTAETDGQFETLLKSEQQGADVYYVAPQFVDWPEYLAHFEQQKVLEHSLLVPPSWIRQALIAAGDDDGVHRVVYDRTNSYVCSEPESLGRVTRDGVLERVFQAISRKEDLGHTLVRVFAGLDERASVRRPRSKISDEPASHEGLPSDEAAPDEGLAMAVPEGFEQAVMKETRETRKNRLEALKRRADSEDAAVAAALGIEAWSLGIQMVLATEP